MILAVPEPIQWTSAIGGIVGALAWPLAVLALGIIFRRHIGAILGRATHAKVGPLELDMQEQQEDAIVEGLTEDPTGPEGDLPRRRGRVLLGVTYFQAAKENPLNAIIEGFLGVERWLNKVLQDHLLNPWNGMTKRSVLDMAQLAHSHGLLGDEMLEAVERLSALRDTYVHPEAVAADLEDARAFLTLADGTITLMEADVEQYDLTHPSANA